MEVSSHLSPRVSAWLAVAAAGLLAGVVLRRADLLVLAAPFLVAPLVALADRRSPGLVVSTSLDRVRSVEGDEVVVAVALTAGRRLGRVELGAILPRGIVSVGARRVSVTVRPGEPRLVELRLRADRWGTYALGGVAVRARDRTGMWTWVVQVRPTDVIRVHPAPETIRTLVRARDTQLASGAQVAREKASGLEPADLRPYATGDPMRDVNWRATARRGELWVTERHPERTTDVVVFVDVLSEFDVVAAVRIAVTLATAYLRDHDRVGLVSFGGSLSWVRPGSGLLQQVRMVDHLLGTTVWDSSVGRDLAVLPPGTLPPRSLVTAVSALDDDRAVAALANLRDRGIDLAVVEIVPHEGDSPPTDAGDALARRLWLLRRAEVRSRLSRSGIAVVGWSEERPVDALLGELQRLRGRGRLVHR